MESNEGPVWGSCRYKERLLQHRSLHQSEGKQYNSMVNILIHVTRQSRECNFNVFGYLYMATMIKQVEQKIVSFLMLHSGAG